MTWREREPRPAPAQPVADPVPPPAAAEETADAFLDRLEAAARVDVRSLASVDAVALDALAASLARGAGASELAIGEGLDLLARTGGDIRLGFSGTGDLARQRLGLPADQARRLRRIAERLRSRPLLRDAVVRGEVTLRKAEVVAPAALGSEEAYWVARARVDTVRRLEAAVRGGTEHDGADWHRLRIGLPPAEAKTVEAALDVAGILIGPTAPVWKRIGAIAMEFLSSYPVDPLERIAPRPPPAPSAAWASPRGPRTACGAPAAPLAPCAALAPTAAPPAARGAPGAREPAPDPYDVLDRLAAIVRGRAGADERLGRACLLVRRLGVWGRLGYLSFDEWCADRLGLAPSTVRQRVALERRMQQLPPLREALRSGRLSYEQARLVARVARPGDVAARIEEAAAATCIAYRRALEQEADRQMWRASELRALVPDDVDELVSDALRAARTHSARRLTPGEALVAVCVHFVLTWKEEVERILRATHPVLLRDGGLCTIPGCSRPADHVHHLWRRSDGGPREPWNETSLCAPHHLAGVHRERVRITGTAPDGLEFTLGEREVRAARRAPRVTPEPCAPRAPHAARARSRTAAGPAAAARARGR